MTSTTSTSLHPQVGSSFHPLHLVEDLAQFLLFLGILTILAGGVKLTKKRIRTYGQPHWAPAFFILPALILRWGLFPHPSDWEEDYHFHHPQQHHTGYPQHEATKDMFEN
jgi:hypothetical protein